MLACCVWCACLVTAALLTVVYTCLSCLDEIMPNSNTNCYIAMCVYRGCVCYTYQAVSWEVYTRCVRCYYILCITIIMYLWHYKEVKFYRSHNAWGVCALNCVYTLMLLLFALFLYSLCLWKCVTNICTYCVCVCFTFHFLQTPC